jgi:hypothetical protein
MGDDKTPFERKGAPAPEKQNEKWVRMRLKTRSGVAIVKHLMLSHKEGDTCICGIPTQEILDGLEWDHPSKNAFYYASAYRHYPRVMKLLPSFNHTKYVKMFIEFKTIPEIFTLFASTNTPYDSEELRRRLNKKCQGSWWADPVLGAWFTLQKSSKHGMLRRWWKCDVLKPLVEELREAEVVVGVMQS